MTDLLTDLRDQIAEIVIPDGIDAGVILLSDDSPSDYDEQQKCHVYRHQNFSPLGDALVSLWQRVDIAVKERNMDDRMLKWFEYAHLPEHLQEISRPFCELATRLCNVAMPGPERTVSLRKLLEAKDAAVRAKLNPGG